MDSSLDKLVNNCVWATLEKAQKLGYLYDPPIIRYKNLGSIAGKVNCFSNTITLIRLKVGRERG